MRIMGKELEDILVGKQHIVILTHMAPDGDAMGSALALYHWIQICQSKGRYVSETVCAPSAQRSVAVIVPNAFPAFYSWMPGAELIKIYEKEPDACSALIAAANLFICTDFNDPKRINPAGEKMLANPAPKILIDHHLKGTMDNGQWTKDYSDPSASSACEIVYRLIADHSADGVQTAGQVDLRPLTLTEDIATCLYTGLMTDTGNFSYSSSRPEVFEMAAALLRAGIDKDAIHHAVFDQYSTDRVRLTGYALSRKMRIYPEHHLALITLSADELDQYHYQQGDCEGLVNIPLQIADVCYSVLMREERPKPGTPKPRIRISFRSQGEHPVNIWANEVFHGGGHMNASGGEIFGSLAQAVQLFEKTYKTYIKQ